MNIQNVCSKIKIIIKKIIYFGFKYKCNICNSSVRCMLPGGIKHEFFERNIVSEAGYRENCFCPVCYSRDRIRLVYYYMKKYTDIFNGKNTILHFAPELVIKDKILKNKLVKYYDGDIKKGRASYIVDIRKIQFEDNMFDYIICNQVLEHILEEEQAILELKRVIKPQGKIIITVPICISNEYTIENNGITNPQKRLEVFGQKDHVRLYGRDFKKRLEKYGFSVEEYDFEKIEGIEKAKKFAMPKYGLIYIASKKDIK